MSTLPVRILWLRLGSAEVGIPADGIAQIAESISEDPRPRFCLAHHLGLEIRRDLPPRVIWTINDVGIEVAAEMAIREHEAADLLSVPAFLNDAWDDLSIHALASRGGSLALVLNISDAELALRLSQTRLSQTRLSQTRLSQTRLSQARLSQARPSQARPSGAPTSGEPALGETAEDLSAGDLSAGDLSAGDPSAGDLR